MSKVKTKKPTTAPRVPMGVEEAFAWGYMIGYSGLPETMQRAFEDYSSGIDHDEESDDEDADDCVDRWGSEGAPSFLDDEEAESFMRGYWEGVSMYSDHEHPEDRGE